jgi:hypothetical protein
MISMEQDLKQQLLNYITKIDKLGKQLSTIRQQLTKLLYRLPKDEIPPIKLPKEEVFALKTSHISESLSSSPHRYERRNKRLDLDDFVKALEKSCMNVGQQVHQMSYMVGAETGCKVTVNGEDISIFQYDDPLTWRRSLEAVANENLMMYKEVEHKDWDSILRIFNSL